MVSHQGLRLGFLGEMSVGQSRIEVGKFKSIKIRVIPILALVAAIPKENRKFANSNLTSSIYCHYAYAYALRRASLSLCLIKQMIFAPTPALLPRECKK